MTHVGESFSEVHPSTAEHYGVDDGDYVRVHSCRGDIVVKAQVTERISEGVLFSQCTSQPAQSINSLRKRSAPTPVFPNAMYRLLLCRLDLAGVSPCCTFSR
ncbi:molybdopterin dinucleotide binding domain-containing protein [Halopelagius fulvigenes]|uniref:Molybdopterin dinucleotide binding domain-containing protein n=1 Tax=Halopelagius fulvigenes TaxID=1198324 RepID=A0ABD5TWM6_9EURY